MLYVTTRSDRDAFTAYKVLRESVAPDGGRYLPMRFPVYSPAKIQEIADSGFSASVAVILNTFFACNLTGWDIEFCIGRKAAKLITMNHRITVAELWHNTGASYTKLLTDLYNRIVVSEGKDTPSDWFCIAVRIAVLFGIYSEMCRQNVINCGDLIDVSVPADDFSIPISAHYARYMGLPVSTIVCTCNDSSIWDFIHLGELSAVSADAPIISGFERLINSKLSQKDLDSYTDAVHYKKTFTVSEEKLSILNQGYYCIVVSDSRSDQAINSIFRNTQYIANPECAICIAGLQDYRAKTGESRPTLIFSDSSPLEDRFDIARATGIAATKLSEYINL